MKACYHRENGPFDEELAFFFISKMAGDRAISLLCFLEVEVIFEVQNGLYMDLESAMVKEEIPFILTFLNHSFPTIPKQ